MPPCQPCRVILKHYPRDPQLHRMHCETCPHCAARLVQKIQRLFTWPKERKVAECRQVLTDWTRHGHSEVLIRKLAKQDAWAVADVAPLARQNKK